MVAKDDYLKFENKELIEVLKAETKKKNKNKRLNWYSEEDNSPQLFSSLRI